jgi:hypothetical protein
MASVQTALEASHWQVLGSLAPEEVVVQVHLPVAGSQEPSGSQRKAGQQSSTKVPILSLVPAGQAGAGVGLQATADEQIGWQLKCEQQSTP